jgi:hypothetical protein
VREQVLAPVRVLVPVPEQVQKQLLAGELALLSRRYCRR